MLIFPVRNPFSRNREIKAKFLGSDFVGTEVIFSNLTAEGRMYNTAETVEIVSIHRIIPGRTWINVNFHGVVSLKSIADDDLVYRAN